MSIRDAEWLPPLGWPWPWPAIDRSPTWPFGPFMHWLGPDDGHPWFTITEEPPLERIEFGLLPEVTEAERFLRDEVAVPWQDEVRELILSGKYREVVVVLARLNGRSQLIESLRPKQYQCAAPTE